MPKISINRHHVADLYNYSKYIVNLPSWAERWPIKIDDPRIALGFVQVARLSFDYDATREIQEHYRRQLQDATLVDIKHYKS